MDPGRMTTRRMTTRSMTRQSIAWPSPFNEAIPGVLYPERPAPAENSLTDAMKRLPKELQLMIMVYIMQEDRQRVLVDAAMQAPHSLTFVPAWLRPFAQEAYFTANTIMVFPRFTVVSGTEVHFNVSHQVLAHVQKLECILFIACLDTTHPFGGRPCVKALLCGMDWIESLMTESPGLRRLLIGLRVVSKARPESLFAHELANFMSTTDRMHRLIVAVILMCRRTLPGRAEIALKWHFRRGQERDWNPQTPLLRKRHMEDMAAEAIVEDMLQPRSICDEHIISRQRNKPRTGLILRPLARSRNNGVTDPAAS